MVVASYASVGVIAAAVAATAAMVASLALLVVAAVATTTTTPHGQCGSPPRVSSFSSTSTSSSSSSPWVAALALLAVAALASLAALLAWAWVLWKKLALGGGRLAVGVVAKLVAFALAVACAGFVVAAVGVGSSRQVSCRSASPWGLTPRCSLAAVCLQAHALLFLWACHRCCQPSTTTNTTTTATTATTTATGVDGVERPTLHCVVIDFPSSQSLPSGEVAMAVGIPLTLQAGEELPPTPVNYSPFIHSFGTPAPTPAATVPSTPTVSVPLGNMVIV